MCENSAWVYPTKPVAFSHASGLARFQSSLTRRLKLQKTPLLTAKMVQRYISDCSRAGLSRQQHCSSLLLSSPFSLLPTKLVVSQPGFKIGQYTYNYLLAWTIRTDTPPSQMWIIECLDCEQLTSHFATISPILVSSVSPSVFTINN